MALCRFFRSYVIGFTLPRCSDKTLEEKAAVFGVGFPFVQHGRRQKAGHSDPPPARGPRKGNRLCHQALRPMARGFTATNRLGIVSPLHIARWPRSSGLGNARPGSDGEIGRHSALKMRRPDGLAGSSPAPSTRIPPVFPASRFGSVTIGRAANARRHSICRLAQGRCA